MDGKVEDVIADELAPTQIEGDEDCDACAI
mgnify:FL=1